ncbi:2-hydroxyacid dehydrogenase [Solicola gregarius]|uniref:D-glycerate dehydrogenase n=1 Tax=Solicola gregarius TaxID=2908642 RepID=A0AA46YM74_9ACTN|nr:D-glycerate dehydrogenase [Solicola gregarius]UYM06359.1 D-glycerate dehydrogenase [Solicola gregarius]
MYGGRGAPSQEDLRHGATGAIAIISTVNETIDSAVMDAAGPGLRIVANCAVGYDNVDLAAANERDVLVSNTPGVLDKATADVAFGLLLATARRIVEADHHIRTHPDWHWGPREFLGRDLSAGTTLGIVGMGRIGFEMARSATAFDMRVLAYDPRPLDRRSVDLGVVAADLETVLASSDAITLHCPLTPQTRHLMNERTLALMKQGAVLVNTARGPLVDEAALHRVLVSGQLSGAGLDVFEDEPRIYPGLVELANVVLLPHIASAGDHTRGAMALLAIDNVRHCLEGRPLPTPVGCVPDQR